jgi:DNA invertase Pin-like site-specific DNA recombinase
MYANYQSNAAVLDYERVFSADYVIANYLRISDQDDKHDESNSITNQRALAHNYIVVHNEFANAKIVDYVDDGISGSHTSRKAYQRLMADIKRGAVHCIIVKDLSRIGRDMIDVDDLLMNYLVMFDIRFIAINNGYDSLKSPLSNLELAVINLCNQHYNRDLAQKSISSKITKMKRGEFLSCWALFGYKKSATERNKIIVDEESAKYVRQIFSLAADGNTPSKIAIILNAQDIPTPSEYKKRNGVIGGWKTADPDFTFWNNALVGRILHDLRYTGASVHNMVEVKHPGTNRCLKRPMEEWIIVPDAHEPIISKAEYNMAHEAIRKEKSSDIPLDHIFHGKVKCPVCGHTLRRSNPRKPWFKCNTRYFTDHYDCPDCSITQASIETTVLQSIKSLAEVLIDREALKLAAVQQNGISKAEIGNKIKAEQRAVRLLEESVTKNITALVSGKLSQDAFLSKKAIISNTIAQKNAELDRLREQLEAVSTGKTAIEERMSELRMLLTVEKLDRMLVDTLIEKVLVYGENDIEIVWADSFA